jgi:23S rRNA (cytosine1962-C5)-methyltransferase
MKGAGLTRTPMRLVFLIGLGMWKLILTNNDGVDAFHLPTITTTKTSFITPTSPIIATTRTTTWLKVLEQPQQEGPSKSSGNNNRRGYKKPNSKITIADLKKEVLKDPALLGGKSSTKKKSSRTRQRVENPKQTYLYAAQRKKLEREGTVDNNSSKSNDDDDHEAEGGTEVSTVGTVNKPSNARSPNMEARQMGLTNSASQHCDTLVDMVEPEILGRIRVGEDENGSGAYGYLINKPAGWSILGTSNTQKDQKIAVSSSSNTEVKKNLDQINGLEAFTTEERSKTDAKSGSILEPSGPAYVDKIPGWNDVAKMTKEERMDAGIEDEDYDPKDIPDFDESDILALLSPEEREEYESEKRHQQTNRQEKGYSKNALERYVSLEKDGLDPASVENVKRILARNSSNRKEVASFSSFQRPSVVSWLKNKKTLEGTPVRGGNFWTALAGATDVDDTGVVLLCPKTSTDKLFVEYTEYVAVIGTGNFLAPKVKKGASKEIPAESIDIDIIGRVKKGREGDICQTVRFVISEQASSCSSITDPAQVRFEDGIRGDPSGHPFDRRAPRRLIHCNSMAVSSLISDESEKVETELPDDIAILSDRLNNHKFHKGSFLGRQALRRNPLTNAYREINGVADGFPGWTVDRYGNWLFVQHDEKEYRGPLPSIHDGNTMGVYMLPANRDRGAMGSKDNVRPILLEGQPAPEIIPILENGIIYHVSLDKDLSTGIFLDQRPQRAWLARHCNEHTHVLNCFAHCGAFSVAAATAGASTVSLDLNKKWLDRIEPQLEANGVAFDQRHDCINGDCFEWLEKLSRRGETFDIVILDPPSSSVGKKKRRWSVRNDMDELVQLAAPLVKKGGLLWTTTNSGSLPPIKFANLCRKGLYDAGVTAKLERIQPMPLDFPSVGAQPVKNLVWRIS